MKLICQPLQAGLELSTDARGEAGSFGLSLIDRHQVNVNGPRIGGEKDFAKACLNEKIVKESGS